MLVSNTNVSTTSDQNYMLRVVFYKSNTVDKKIVVVPDPITGAETTTIKYIQMYLHVYVSLRVPYYFLNVSCDAPTVLISSIS